MVVPEGERIAAVEATIKAILAQGQEREAHNESRYGDLAQRMDQIKQDVLAVLNEKHGENRATSSLILAQVTSTNGRLGVVEKWKERIEGGFTGSKTVIGAVWMLVGLVASPIVAELIKALFKAITK